MSLAPKLRGDNAGSGNCYSSGAKNDRKDCYSGQCDLPVQQCGICAKHGGFLPANCCYNIWKEIHCFFPAPGPPRKQHVSRLLFVKPLQWAERLLPTQLCHMKVGERSLDICVSQKIFYTDDIQSHFQQMGCITVP